MVITIPFLAGCVWALIHARAMSSVASREWVTSGVVIQHEDNHNQFHYRFDVDGNGYSGLSQSPAERLPSVIRCACITILVIRERVQWRILPPERDRPKACLPFALEPFWLWPGSLDTTGAGQDDYRGSRGG